MDHSYRTFVRSGVSTKLGQDQIAEKIGCTAETLRKWVRQAERDAGTRPGLTTEERERLKQLERENFELRRANEILRLASAYFAKAELDRRHK
jgi:transposase